jgi:hypothetical protein
MFYDSYYITAAPQCPFPDAYLGAVINAVGFDAVYVQFCESKLSSWNNWPYTSSDNNFCGLQSFDNPNVSSHVFLPDHYHFPYFLFARHGILTNGISSCAFPIRLLKCYRDEWAKTVSPNKNVKVYIGAPSDSLAAGSGYVDADTLASYALQTREQYSSFGGVMLWDASQAYGASLNPFLFKVQAELISSVHRKRKLCCVHQECTVKWWKLGPHSFIDPIVRNEYIHISRERTLIVGNVGKHPELINAHKDP